jgi:glycosyltransferase involved in cell wall biosynthesis
MPFFSVIIPSYNRAAVLPRAITSVLNQRFTDWELLIVDDGSTDATQQQVAAFNDSRIQYIFQDNKGVCAARNYGISLVKGSYVCFLDSDDTVNVNWLEDFFLAILKQPFDVVFCNATIFHLNGTEILKRANYPYQENKLELNGIYLAGIFTINKLFLDKLGGFDEAISFGEFTELGLRARHLEPTVFFNEKNNLTYFVNPSGGGKNNVNKIQSNIYLLQKHEWYFNLYPYSKRLYLQNTAVAFARNREWKSCRNFFWKAYIVQPWKLKTLFRLCFSLFPILAKRIWT